MYDFHHLLFSGIYDFEDFTEMMRALQYPRVVSIESFRAPNFELVADILFWMLKRYDPDIYIHEGIESEDDRVVFLTCVAKAMETRAGIILNIKKLYAADGFAVKELLKISTILYQALQTVCTNYVEEASVLNIQLKDAMVAKSLASDITEIGAKLHGLLNCEVKNKELRERVIRFLSSVTGAAEDFPEKYDHLRNSLAQTVDAASEDLSKIKEQCKELEIDERDLAEKIRKKSQDLEQSQKRLKSLKNVRPAFMDEYEKLEMELQDHYNVYLERFRNLHYLQKRA